MFRRRTAIAAGIAAAALGVFAGAAPAEPLGSAPRCESGQEHAWDNDPSGGQFHGGKLFACFLGEPPATDPDFSFGTAPRCENGQSHAWENDPTGGQLHGGMLFNCSVGVPPGQ
jgi:hypothetical protein